MKQHVAAHLVFLLVALSGHALGLQTEFSVYIEAGQRECYHQYLAKDLNMELDFQVIQGAQLYSCTKQALLQTFGTPCKVRMDKVLRRDHELRQRPNHSISEFVEEY